MIEISSREKALREAAEPALAEAYNAHMTQGGGVIGKDLPIETGTLYPLGLLNRVAGFDEDAGVTPELVTAVRDSFERHVAHYAMQGVDIKPVITEAMHINISTEKNLPWYHGRILEASTDSEAFLAWLSRWTSEEIFHAETYEHWGAQAGALDTHASRRTTVTQIMNGIHVPTNTWPEITAFTDPQEGLTYEAHQNTASLLDSIGRRMITPIGGQELRHQRFFRRVLRAMVEIDFEYVLPIIADTWLHFAMPGKEGIENYDQHARNLAVHGIFSLAMMRQQQAQSANALGLLTQTPKTEAAQKAQHRIAQVIDINSRLNRMMYSKSGVEKATDDYIAQEKAQGRVPVILGRTVVFERTEGKGESNLVVYPNAA